MMLVWLVTEKLQIKIEKRAVELHKIHVKIFRFNENDLKI
jgi:hypothetical protein